jgi:ubiquinone/menaquinone biosynthesis C-methylase UbiE
VRLINFCAIPWHIFEGAPHDPAFPPLILGAGKSSFDLIEPEKLFPALGLKPGEAVLDLGCGEGRYTLPLASRVGAQGTVYAVDLWEEGLAILRDKARQEGVAHLRIVHADVSRSLPLPDACVDVALLATVLHDLAEAGQAQSALAEVARLIKPGGRLAVVEFKKLAGPPGPPLAIRLAPDQVAALLRPYGFAPGELTDLGPHTYLEIFTKSASSQE